MQELLPTKQDRVRAHTSRRVNDAIDLEIESSIRAFAGQTRETLTNRILKLEQEWDIERVLEMNASTLAFIGTILGAFVNPWFLLIPALVTAFLFQHAVQGWCPPMPILRRLRKRTRNEIDAEKFGMKALRGDFDDINSNTGHANLAEKVIQAIRDSR
jgi:hypothetical protein